MPRVSKIKYDPSLSVEKNATINGCSVAAIRAYIGRNNIDRRLERKQNIIATCRRYLKKHPGASKMEMHKATGYGLSTIRQYWGYISTKEQLMDFNANKRAKIVKRYKDTLSTIPIEEIARFLDSATSKKEEPVFANRKELWSDVLKTIPEMFHRADEADVSGLRTFFLEKPEMPMLFIGSGGQNGSVPAFLYGLNKGIGIALTPLQFSSLSDDAVKNARLLLLSKSGKNVDIKLAAERAIKINPENTACLTLKDTPQNNLLQILRGTSARIFLFDNKDLSKGFTSVSSKFLNYGMFFKAFTGVKTISELVDIVLSPDQSFKVELNKVPDEFVDLERVEHICVLYGGYGEPVAKDFESVMTESGLASVQVCDYRNYCHGRFIFPTNHTENTKEPRFNTNVAMMLLVSPREKKLAQKIRKYAVPIRTPVITIETEQDNAIGLIDMLIKSNVFVGFFGEQVKRINPYSPPNYHAKEVDKRGPIGILKDKQTSSRR